MTSSDSPAAPGPAQTLAALDRHRPELAEATRRALPGARASILARLWGALTREPVAAVAGRLPRGTSIVLRLADGRILAGAADAAAPYAAVDTLTVTVDGAPYADPAALVRALDLPGTGDRLARELDNSVANLALARAAQPAPHGGPPALSTLAEHPHDALAVVEQYVVDGHPLHPCCRSRIGLSTTAVLAYAPEHRALVQPLAVPVPADRWFGTDPPELVMHPWQWAHLRDAYPWLGRAQPAGGPARALMSLRTLAPIGTHQHVKTSVEVQMTSAVRTVSPAAVRNGPVLSDLLHHLTADLSGIAIMRETGGGAVLVGGEPCRGLACLRREAPRPVTGELPVPLAALAAPSPASGRPLVTEAVALGYGGDPAAFFADLAGVVLPPLLILLHRGVALEAHGQNTLVVLRAGRPVRLLYRDLGGVRVSARRLRSHGVAPPPVHGDLASDEPAVLRTKLFAAAVAGALAEQVAVLHRAYGVEPRHLWDRAAAVARRAYAALPAGASGDAAALFGAALPVKATTAMRLAAAPLDDLWAELPNPLAGLR